MVQLSSFLSLALLACSVSSLPQGNASNGTAGNGKGVVLSEAVLSSLPLNVIVGGNSATVVQASNSSLVQSRPDIVAAATSSLESLPSPPTNLTKRAECIGGPFASPLTPYTNILFMSTRVCDFWFPNNQVYYLPVPLPGAGFLQIATPLGPGLPTITFQYQTKSFPPVNDLVTPMTSTICNARYAEIFTHALLPSSFDCPPGGELHAGDTLDETTHATGFSFVVS